ncbi:transglutaminase-like cysteine peptidase [Catenovulum sp. SM1970]|nr:transglutaminase-like cysteine peptidase [Marinifaba aquimaris]
MQTTYDENAVKRTKAWRRIIEQNHDKDELEQIKRVNQFFNFFEFTTDQQLWQQNDYWATPIEFIGEKAGDCEDFSIAKYFTLIELGMPVEKLRLTYVKALSLNQFHMVLAYYPKPSAMPLILDNIDGEIKPASARKDLVPVFSFNAQKLWLNKQKGRGQLVGSSQQLDSWSDLTSRYQLTDFFE